MSAVLTKVVAVGLNSVADDSEAVLARDSNAVPSVFWPEQRWLGTLLSTEYGKPSARCYALQGLPVVLGVFMLLTVTTSVAEAAGMAEPNELQYIFAALNGLACAALSLAVSSAREALRPGGALEQLCVGEVLISAEEAHSNVQRLLWAVRPVGHHVGRLCALPPFVPPGAPMEMMRIMMVLNGLLFCTVLPVAFSGWWASLRTASCLCRDATVEVIKATRNTDPADEEEWEEKVNRPALALRGKFELLSRGWAGGLAGLGGFCWLLALGAFALALRAVGQHMVAARVQFMAIAAGAALLPFPLAWDIAHTSSFCDLLVDELNEVRIRHGVACDAKITHLEVALGNLVRWPCIALPRAPAPAASMAVEVILVLPCSVYTFATYARRTEARASVLCLVGTSSTSAA